MLRFESLVLILFLFYSLSVQFALPSAETNRGCRGGGGVRFVADCFICKGIFKKDEISSANRPLPNISEPPHLGCLSRCSRLGSVLQSCSGGINKVIGSRP